MSKLWMMNVWFILNLNICIVFLSVWEIFRSTFVGITFKSFQFRFEAITSSIVLQTLVFWRPSHLNASQIFKRTPIYRPARHTILEIAAFHSSEINEFHPNTQEIHEIPELRLWGETSPLCDTNIIKWSKKKAVKTQLKVN